MKKAKLGLVCLRAPSNDTILVLRELLAQAEAGDLVGISYTAQYRERHWSYGSAGEATKNPVMTIGLLQVQCAEMAQILTGGFSE